MRDTDRNAYLIGFASTQQKVPDREEALPVDPARNQTPFLGMMVDAGTDLSGTMAADRRMRILPLSIHWPGRTVVDKGDAEVRLVSRQLSHERIRSAEVAAPSEEALSYRMHPHLAINFDRLLIIATHPALIEASSVVERMLLAHHQEIVDLRRSRKLPPDYVVQVVNSRSLLSGPALLARLLLGTPETQRGDLSGLAHLADRLAQHLQLWIAPGFPGDLAMSLQRRENGELQPWIDACSPKLIRVMQRYPILTCRGGRFAVEGSAKNWKAAVAEIFQTVGNVISSEALAASAIQISMDGRIRDLRDWPEFQALKAVAAAHQVRVHVTHMSLGGRVWASANSLSLALIRRPNAPD